MPKVFAVLTAAGSGTRLGWGIPKALVPLAGRSILDHALSGLLAALGPQAQIAVTVPGEAQARAEFERALAALPLPPGFSGSLRAVPGGDSRQASVRAGLEYLSQTFSPADTEPVLVHDAARPLVPAEVFARLLKGLSSAPGVMGVIPVLPVVDTIKEVTLTDAPGSALPVRGTLPREALRAVQTPQAFAFGPLLAAHRNAQAGGQGDTAPDDAYLLEQAGHRVLAVEGSALSHKITTAQDLAYFEYLLAGAH